MDYMKAERVGKNKWRVLSIPFGGPFEGKDLDGEYFSARTDIKPDWFDRRPLVWQHNLDATMKADPVMGTADDTELEDDGWWSTLWLDRSHRYWAQVNALLEAGKIFGSSGTLQTFAKTDRTTGEILVWPFIEQTLTPTPANPYARVVAAKAVSHFDEAGLALPAAVRGIFSDLDGPTADLRPDLATAVDAAMRERLAGDVLRLVERAKTL
jgi:hypothetical protein